jgi:very-short-patch-repair endonuclease
LIEKKLYDRLSSETNLEFQENIRTIIPPFEIDIVCREKKVAIEVDGYYFHSEDFKQSDYHLKKTDMANNNGFDMIHIFDFELYNKFDIAVSLIKSKLGKSSKRIHARKCITKEVGYNEALIFINQSHMQGAHAASVGTKRYGLYYNNELVSIMTFGKPRYDKLHEWELMRFCCALDTNIPGAASKLLKYAKTHGISNIISYANRRWSNGNVYEKIGFVEIRRSPPNYFYVKGSKVLSRISAQKGKLSKLLGDGFNEKLSEKENMKTNGWKVVYDCGNIVYSL